MDRIRWKLPWPGVAGILLLALGCVGEPPFEPARDCKRARATGRDMGLMFHALEQHHRTLGRYPDTGHEVAALARALEPTWMVRVPTEDAWGNPLLVDVTSTDWTIATQADGQGLIKLSRIGLTGWSWSECGCPGDLLRPPERAP